MSLNDDLFLLVLASIAVTAVLVSLPWWLSHRALLQERARERERDLEQVEQLRNAEQKLQERLEQEQKETQHWYTEHEKLLVAHQREQQHLQEKIQLLEKSEARLEKEFENLANRIFEQKTAALEQRQEKSLASTLSPLQKQLEGFRQQIAQQFSDETKQRAGLQQEISSLRQLNQQMSAEAEALTRALKGDTRQQGTWGEVVLERILQQSGLREGREYTIQSQHRNDDGKRYRPDVIVHLPKEKDVIIDSKVSLSAYERYFNSDDDSVRAQALNEHVQSLRNHIRELGKKSYQQLDGVRTLDYVLLFVPIEPAFLLAVDRDPELIKLALDQHIMLVSPTNLLVALRTVNNIWQYEQQNQNAQRIAQDAARLYDKFANFVDDLQKIGQALEGTRKHWDAAMNKLSTGRGNLLGRVEKFRELGVQPAKQIDRNLLADDDTTSPDESER
ncbi:DNA recombination protein RmuC [Aliidiomarina haloalkalitolerans]|uniref:DNA recombination protein RmuC n=1 Tax=Aliidiomarina haloalkalitolerans TaxID=859059 RepID=A0A432VXK5_9GAMM|nr:DNA recombination protein RmuC [Aliidiomarina haloalkalitolerans]RUO21431.1 DNA recombination protein RmuC [Aliidiomarina haloalkalitolerans]